MKNRRTLFLVAGILSAMPLNAALTAIQTAGFSFTADSSTFDANVGLRALYSESVLGPFTRFDTSLGTLNEVRLTIEINAKVIIELASTAVDDELSLFTMDWDGYLSSYAQTSIIYKPTGGGGGGPALTFDILPAPPLGITDADPASYGGGGGFFASDFFEADYGGYADGGTTATTGGILVTDPAYNSGDFEGTGDVTGLVVATTAEIDTTVFLDNLFSAILDVTVELEPGTATLQYDYTPVPEPRYYGGLLGLAALLFLFRRRNKQ